MDVNSRGIDTVRSEIGALKRTKEKLDREIVSAKEQGKETKDNLDQQRSFVCRMIVNLEEKLLEANAGRTVEEGSHSSEHVKSGSRVTVEDVTSKEVAVYTLVRASESDSARGMISIHSPIAKGLLDCREGALTLLPLQDGPHTVRILKIEASDAPTRDEGDRRR